MRVAFAGTPEFARAALAQLHAAGFTLPLVLTQPDRPAGRGLKLAPSSCKAFSLEHDLPVTQPRSLRLDGKYGMDAEAAQTALRQVRPDVLAVAAYGLILPRWLLDLPRLGCINVHASLLPRWRGAAPVQRAIEAGDDATGVTIMQMDEGLDTGDMLLVERCDILADDTAQTLTERLASIGARLLIEALELAARGALTATRQPDDGVTYAQKIDKREAPIDWALPAEVIERRVRAFDPFPGATFPVAGHIVKLWRARVIDASGVPGTVLRAADGEFLVACGANALSLLSLQRAGGRRLDAREFLQRTAVEAGMRLAD